MAQRHWWSMGASRWDDDVLDEFGRIPDMRTLSREECLSLVERIVRFVRGGGSTDISIRCWGNGELRWARNRISMASDRRDLFVEIRRTVNGGRGSAVTNQTDDVSLAAAVLAAERLAARSPAGSPRDMPVTLPALLTPAPVLWSSATTDATPIVRSSWALISSDQAEAKAMVVAGYTEARSTSIATFSWTDDLVVEHDAAVSTGTMQARIRDEMQYTRLTQAQCSMTIRHPLGVGSGWAGLSGYDWAAIDGTKLARRALEKCLASINPVRIEPGRYTVVLEPQAVNDLVTLLLVQTELNDPLARVDVEMGSGPFPLGKDEALKLVRTKLGLKIVDERITVSHDPMDPLLGVIPEPGLMPVTWIERGILKSFNHSRKYALSRLGEHLGVLYRPSYRMSGGSTSMEEMIKTTQRGLLVTRFSNLRVLDDTSLVATGVTRDGLWLIERGKITHAVKNMRITESPLFVLNQVEQLGEPVPVFRPITGTFNLGISPAIVPPLKANDFSFTSTVDAV